VLELTARGRAALEDPSALAEMVASKEVHEPDSS
jgi:hypothetical protein